MAEALEKEKEVVLAEANGSLKAKEDEPKKQAGSVPYYKLFRYADWLDYLLMALGTLGAVVNGIGLPLVALLLGNLTDSFGQNVGDPNKLLSEVSKVALNFVLVAIGIAAAAFLQCACWIWTGERQSQRLRQRYLRAVLRQNIGYFDTEVSTGAVIDKMSGDVVLVQEAIGEKVGTYIQHMCTFLGGFIIAFVRGWLLSLVMLSTLPLMGVAGFFMGKVIQGLASGKQEAYGKAGTVVEENVGGIRTVYSFVGENKALEKYSKHLEPAYKSMARKGWVTGASVGFMLMVMFGTYALALWYGSRLIAKGMANGTNEYTGGRVLNVLFAIIIGGMSLGQAAPAFSAFAAGSAAAFGIFKTIERTPEIDVQDLSGVKLEIVRGDVALSNVSFAYPARPDVLVFNNFSLTVPSGKTVALVGESGSGKSSVVSLIERFYDPQQGTVSLDGVDIKKLQLKWYRAQLGLVSQEPVLFATTIFENLQFGKEDATQAEMEEACKLANIHTFIAALPEGYQTQVGERGAQLSGGQKQRLAIARAVLKNPRILLLDEATSALDTESEALVQQALERLMLGRTTVVIAHRLTTVRNADAIAVVQRGNIVETGTHAQLLSNKNGAYSQLVRLQELQHNEDAAALKSSSRLGTAPIGNATVHADPSPNALNGEAESKVMATPDLEKGDDALIADKEKPSPGKKQPSPLARLIQLNAPEWPYAIVGLLGAIGNGLVFPIFAILLSGIIKTFYNPEAHKLKKEADMWAIWFAVMAGGAFLALLFMNGMFDLMGARLVRRVRQLCFAAVLRQEVGYFDDPKNSAGAVGARLSTDAAQVSGLVGDRMALVAQNLATMIAGLTIAFVAGWQLALVVLAVVPLLGVSGYMQVQAMKGMSANAKLAYEEASGVANDGVSSIRTVAAFGAEDRVMRVYKEKSRAPMKAGLRTGLISGLGFAFSFFILFSVYGMAFWAGGQFVKKGWMEFENVFRVFFAVVLSAMGMAQATAIAPDMAKAQDSISSIFGILDREPKIVSDAPEGKKLAKIDGNINFDSVFFHYPSRPDIPILQGLTLSITSGKTVALVGESGSGKSTVIALIERFYDPQSGMVLIDGVDSRTFNLKWLRQQIGLVSQEPVLFDTSIYDNIRYGRDEATDAEIEAAAQAANAHNFISAMPDGYQTLVGERGVQLSGGQKQRVAIARAILKDPRILLLDEATSALDAESEHVVQEALDRAMVSRTTVVIAHRLSTVRNADSLAVVQQGKIVEEGRHDELIRIKGGVYASLAQLHNR